jgi:protein-tyrosine phosphatase
LAGTPTRTSTCSPLRIDAVEINELGGTIGMTICPGKQGDSQYGTAWNRDLAMDLEVICSWGATILVTAMESDEMQHLGVGQLGTAATHSHLQWIHLPVTDGAVPDGRFDLVWTKSAPNMLQALNQGRRVVIHCRGGLGRTGVIACLLLIELGKNPQDALEIVRRSRPGTVETTEQEEFVLNYRPQFEVD